MGGEFAEGFFSPPTILTNVQPDTKIFHDEVFGPVLTVTTFETAEKPVSGTWPVCSKKNGSIVK